MFHQESEPVTLTRDCEAIIIPDGEPVMLPSGSLGYITQSLGGSFTIYLEGNLFRIAGKDADALGKEPVEPPKLPPEASSSDIETVIWEQLKTCFDPEIPINVVDLGLIYLCMLNETPEGVRTVDVQMTLTAPGCGMGEILVADVRDKIEMIPTVERADVELVFDPPWNQSMMSEAARLQTGMMY